MHPCYPLCHCSFLLSLTCQLICFPLFIQPCFVLTTPTLFSLCIFSSPYFPFHFSCTHYSPFFFEQFGCHLSPNFSFIPPLTPGHLLWDRLPNMCGSGPAICRSDANSRPLLLHVPLLRQLWWWDAPTPEEERRLSTWPVGNVAVLHLTGHHVSMTCAR